MKAKLLHIVLLLFSALVVPVCATAQTLNTMGTDFWFAFTGGVQYEYGTLTVSITGLRDCTGTLINTSNHTHRDFTVTANQSTTLVIDNDYTMQTENTISGQWTLRSFHIITTDTVSVYASNFYPASFDATFVLPTPVLRDQYMVQTWQCDTSVWPSQFLVLAVEDSTVIDVVPKATCANIDLPIGHPFSIMLQEGQCILFKSRYGHSDLSGSTIKARDCKPIAVFCGHVNARIPFNAAYGDRLYEQAVPTAYWGKDFILTRSGYHNGDKVKCTALQDDCEIRLDGTAVDTLNAGESFIFTVDVQNPTASLQSSKPVCVYSYMVSKNNSTPHGDPSMVFEAPIEQQLNDVVFINYDHEGQLTSYYFVNVVTQTDNIQNIYLDNYRCELEFLPVDGNPRYSYAIISSQTGSHRLHSNGNEGFVAHSYGVGQNEGFGYSVGFAARNQTIWMSVNDHLNVTDADTTHICLGDSLLFRAGSNTGYDSIGWNFGDGTSASDNDIVHLYDTPGFYYAEVTLVRSSTDCFDLADTSLTVTTGTYIHVHGQPLTLTETEVCDSIVWNGIPNYASFSDTLKTSTVWGCDSTVVNNITVNHSTETVLNLSIFEGDTLTWLDGNIYTDTTNGVSVTLRTSKGCDSIVYLHLNVLQPPEAPVVDSLTLWVPNAFTPDESSNNRFGIFGHDLLSAHVSIFNRWGGLVTQFDGLTDTWDGSYGSTPCPAGAYIVMVEYVSKSRPHYKQVKTSTVTLIR